MVRKAFWGTNVFIYLIERNPFFYPKVLALYEEERRSSVRLATSTFTLGELLVQPLRHNRSDLIEQYAALLSDDPILELVTFDASAARHYAEIRATTSLRQPDAIQLACAVTSGVEEFVTNDKDLWGLERGPIRSVRGL